MEIRRTQILSFWSNFDLNLPPEFAEIRNSHQAIQISQNQDPIYFQCLMKSKIRFSPIWDFFWCK